jgi:ribokinase
MLGAVGRDDFGREMLRNLSSVGCDVSHVEIANGPSGVALIVVSAEGENAIVVASGANHLYTSAMADEAAVVLAGADALLLQLEIPLATVQAIAQSARDRGVRVILDPAPVPVGGLPVEILKLADIVTPNETEAAALTGVATAHDQKITPELATRMAAQLAALGVKTVLLKLGARGCLIHEAGKSTFVPAPKVNAVDTTAAGDVFNGALAVGLSEGLELSQAALFATRAAALSVTRKGAQLSAPARAEVDAWVLAV